MCDEEPDSVDYTSAEAKQAAREAFAGLWAAITTPFDPGGAVDYGRRCAATWTG